MKKLLRHRPYQFAMLICCAIALLANSGNPPAGRTGAPFDGHCNSCHDGTNPNNFDGTISLEGLPATIVPGTTYPLTLTMTATAGNPARGGFELVVVDNNNVDYGDLIVPSGNTSVGTETLPTGREYMEHRNPKNFSGNGSEISWTFNWKAEGTAAGSVAKFYFIGNFCNGSGDANDFPLTANLTVPVNAAPVALNVTISTTNVSCSGGNDGTATANVSGGTGTYTYNWNNGQTGQTISNLSIGVFSVTVTDSGGATGTATTNITQPTPLSAFTFVSGSVTCNNPSATITATGGGAISPYSYAWPDGTTGPTVTVFAPGVYTVTVTDANNCTKTGTASVSGNINPPNAAATNVVINCTATTATLSGAGSATGAGITYVWTPPAGGSIVSGQGTLSPVVSGIGEYNLLVTNTATGCTNTASATVSYSPPPQLTTFGTTLTCAVPSNTITASSTSGAATYSWAGPNFTSNLQSPTVTLPGLYTVTVTNTGTGCTNTANVTVVGNFTQPNLFVNTTTATCTQPISTATASSSTPGTQLGWTWPGGSSSQATIVLEPGIVYTAVATSTLNGCTSTSTATYSGNTQAPTISTTSSNITCNNSTASVSAMTNLGVASYSWSGLGIIAGQGTGSITVDEPGIYTVTVTNPTNGCTSSSTSTVQQLTTPPVATIATPATLNCTVTSVTLNASGSTQNAFITYSWAGPSITGGGSTLFPVVNAPGPYTVTVLDNSSGCSATATTTVIQLSSITASASSTAALCFGGNNGTAMASGAGGSGTYTYIWSNNTTGSSISGLVQGTYTVTATDANGCTATATTTVGQPATPVSANATATAITSQGVNNGTATAAPTGGTAPYTYTWSTGAFTASIEDLAPGSYTVTVLDANNCQAIQTVTVNNFNCVFSASISTTAATCFGSNNGTASVTVQNSVNPILYLWSNQAVGPNVGNLAPGTYTVTVADASNCPVVLSATISEPSGLNVSVVVTGETSLGANNGTATANVTGGTSPYTYLWSNSLTTGAISNLSPGIYTVTVTDGNGCTTVQGAAINGFNCQGQPTVSVDDVNCNGESSGSALADLVGGTAPVTYAWSNGFTTQGITNLTAGTYIVTMTDANGCVAQDTAVVTEPAPVVVEIANIFNTSCPNQQSGYVTIQVSGGNFPAYSFNYPGSGQTLLGAGIYNVTVTPPNGCTQVVEFSILAIDTIAPTITCPSNIAQCDAGDVTNFANPAVIDNCLPVGLLYEVVEGLPSGSYFPPGTTLQVMRVTDAGGNSSLCSFTVTTYPIPDVLLVSTADDIDGTGVGSIDITPVMGTAPYTFNWSLNGQPFASTEDLSNLFTGQYFLTLTDFNGCEVSLAPIFIDNVVGTATPFANAGMRIWPNPVGATDQLRIDFGRVKPTQLLIINSLGQTVYTQHSLFSAPLPADQLAAGAYTLLVVGENGDRYYATFIRS